MSLEPSEPTPQYNCIAWAFEDNNKWWWPVRGGYWPVSFAGKSVMEAFEECFIADGWERTDDRSVQVRHKKIAVYANVADGQPTHAARQLETGAWTSKLGKDIDITHELHELEGPTYGTVVAIYKKSF